MLNCIYGLDVRKHGLSCALCIYFPEQQTKYELPVGSHSCTQKEVRIVFLLSIGGIKAQLQHQFFIFIP